MNTIEDLKELRKQLDTAIAMIEEGKMRPLTAREKYLFYPDCDLVIGNFSIKRHEYPLEVPAFDPVIPIQ